MANQRDECTLIPAAMDAIVPVCLRAFPSVALSKFICFPIFMLFELGGSKAEVSVLPKRSKATNDFSITYVNWQVAIRPATITHITHTRGAHTPTDTLHPLEIKIPGYLDVMGQLQGTGSSRLYSVRTRQPEYLH